MLDLSWSEILVIMVVALIFIGPKDLPDALRTLGKWTAKARAMAQEFRGHVDDFVRESEIDKVRQEVDKIQNMDIGHEIEKTVDPKGEIGQALSAPDLTLEQPTTPKEAVTTTAEANPAPSIESTVPTAVAPAPAPEAVSPPASTSTVAEAAPAPARTAAS